MEMSWSHIPSRTIVSDSSNMPQNDLGTYVIHYLASSGCWTPQRFGYGKPVGAASEHSRGIQGSNKDGGMQFESAL